MSFSQTIAAMAALAQEAQGALKKELTKGLAKMAETEESWRADVL